MVGPLSVLAGLHDGHDGLGGVAGADVQDQGGRAGRLAAALIRDAQHSELAALRVLPRLRGPLRGERGHPHDVPGAALLVLEGVGVVSAPRDRVAVDPGGDRERVLEPGLGGQRRVVAQDAVAQRVLAGVGVEDLAEHRVLVLVTQAAGVEDRRLGDRVGDLGALGEVRERVHGRGVVGVVDEVVAVFGDAADLAADHDLRGGAVGQPDLAVRVVETAQFDGLLADHPEFVAGQRVVDLGPVRDQVDVGLGLRGRGELAAGGHAGGHPVHVVGHA